MATLFVVATPLGNLGDLSPRAARVLGEVACVAAESVTRARKLLSHLGLGGKRLVSCREANRRRAATLVVAELGLGRDVALISDAGTPGVSDPGQAVVAAAAAAGHRVSPLPGPSALAAGASVAGMAATPLVFLGFCPAKPGARRKLLTRARLTGWPVLLFEAPHRLAAAAADLVAVFGERRLTLCRELSKLNEEVAHLTTTELLRRAGSWGDTSPRGEITLVVAGEGEGIGGGELGGERDGGERDVGVGGATSAAPSPEVDDPGARAEELLRRGLAEGKEPPGRLARRVARATGLARDEVYRRLLAQKAGR